MSTNDNFCATIISVGNKFGTVLIDKSLEAEAFSEVLSLRYDLVYFKDISLFSPAALTSQREVKLCILNDFRCDLTFQVSHLANAGIDCKKLVVLGEVGHDRITQLRDYGVDEILFRPFRVSELLYRCEQTLSLAPEQALLPRRINGISITGLTMKERRLLAVFLLAPAFEISRENLFDQLWRSISVNRKTLDVHLFNLRKKLRPHGFDVVFKENKYRLVQILTSIN
ncbi:MAG: hypothetical protein EOP06_00340 [Proteobacteria bacterium]|nr:MAG: hypothetical protein EOP06_00340 [Pseudomonadota bacterium]